MRNVFMALVSVGALILVLGVIASHAVPPTYTFEDRTQLQMLIDACRTGHHLCR